MCRSFIFSFTYITFCLVLTEGISRDEEIEQQVEEALKWEDNFVPKTRNTELVGVDLASEGKDFGTFDFIIVGSGSSGSALASRLTEIKKWSILLLEAGDESKHEVLNIPYYSHLSTYANETWNYLSTPQKNGCLTSNNRQCTYNVGKVLGGNTKTWVPYNRRGNDEHYNSWAELGNNGWSYEEVLPYFKKLENFSINHNSEYHGFSGPVHVEHVKPKIIAEDIVLKAWSEIGIEYNPDYNGASSYGAARIQYFTKNGVKSSADNDYIRPILNRHNFKLSLKSFVTKILIDSKTKAAIGVKFVKNGQVYYANTRQEVILTAGAIQTSQLLWLSGIGPKKDLERLNIPVVTNLPVGLFIKDFLFTDIYITADYKIETTLNKCIADYLDGEGLLTTAANYRQNIKVDVHNPKSNNKTSILMIWAPASGIDNFVPAYSNSNSSIKRKKFPSTQTYKFTIVSAPESQGTIKLKSNNPVDFPEIDPCIFSRSEDLEVLYQGAKFLEKFLSAPRLQRYNHHLLTAFPEENKHKPGSESFWKTEFQLGTRPMARVYSTLKMGPKTDPDAVVDSWLNVRNVNNLRAVGKGVLPIPIQFSDTLGYMIGEKAADIIKSNNGQLSL